MKKIFKSILGAGVAVVGLGVLSACTAEKFDVLDPNGVPDAANIDVTVTVDPETNEYCLTLNNAQGCYPVWNVHLSDTKTEISTQNGKRGIITTKGEYPVEVRVGNRNGVSTGSKTVNIVIDHTIVDYGPYIQRLTAGDTKTWMIARDEAGHLGCGPAHTEGLEWWSAQPNDKAAWGVYDNRMTFGKTEAADGGAYTYDPGASGTIYVNTGITDLPPYSASNTNDGNDYCAPAEKQETTFTLVSEDDKLYLVFPQGTLMGYLPNVEAYNEPKFEVLSISGSMVDLAISNNDIAWHYKLGLEGEAPFMGFKYDSEYNLFRNATCAEPVIFYAHGGGWELYPAPFDYTVEENGYTFSLPGATDQQWQAQFKFLTDIVTSADKTYDMSVVISSNKDLPGVTFKATHETLNDKGEAEDVGEIINKTEAVAAGEDHVIWCSDVKGIDTDKLKIVFDFGGNPEGAVITVKNIVIKDHANNDGTVLPNVPDEPEVPEAPVNWCDIDSDLNFWHGITYDLEMWTSGADWSGGVANPVFTQEGNGFTVEYTEAPGAEQWKAQVKLHTPLTTSVDKNYDFRITVSATNDIPGATFKLVHSGGEAFDGIFYFADRKDLVMDETHTFKWVNLPGIDMTAVSLVLDFGGAPQGTKITVKDIIFQEHAE